jgi:hypothetical protein
MSKPKYDAWAMKSFCGRNPWIINGSVRETRKEVLEWWYQIAGDFRLARRRGTHKIVKVKILEA